MSNYYCTTDPPTDTEKYRKGAEVGLVLNQSVDEKPATQSTETA